MHVSESSFIDAISFTLQSHHLTEPSLPAYSVVSILSRVLLQWISIRSEKVGVLTLLRSFSGSADSDFTLLRYLASLNARICVMSPTKNGTLRARRSAAFGSAYV